MKGQGEFCKQVPSIYESFLKVIFDHAVGEQILGPTTNPCPTFFSSQATGDVWNGENWGNYPQGNDMVKLPLKPVKRLIAIGDVHGDVRKTREALQIAKLLGPRDKWCGGKTVLVQVGDVFDRGKHEIKIWYLLEKLRRGASRDGGAVHVLHGNHETENLMGRYKYVFKDGFAEFDHWKRWYDIQNSMKGMVKGCSPTIDYEKGLPKLRMLQELAGLDVDSQVGKGILARLEAMRPGGPIATQFVARCPAVLVIGKSMFVHGGIKFSQVVGGFRTLNGYNLRVNEWVKGKSGVVPPDIISSSSGRGTAVTWNRDLGQEDKESVDCKDVLIALYTMRLERLVIGHTIQSTGLINSACNEKVIRIDVGMSKGCGDKPPQALEILDDERCNVLSAKGSMPLSEADKLPPRTKYGPDDDDDAGETSKRPGKKRILQEAKKKTAKKPHDGDEGDVPSKDRRTKRRQDKSADKV